ncbi:asparagine synthase (glutamine-hydrolyzing) [Flavisolibacter nicotianae]|uniref:asparagine synthase (glutamine-hydrolyzing) n=1 Tax=Flavisolibacter nicotianae TaxID=2364882 RepID=UPI000EB129DD|nr:asparagine synthase (glutamine-hydrolyzing) [Flavisolibacter nicotianae]
MCGLTGFCDFNKRLNAEHLAKANDTLVHRGPDSGDQAFFPESAVNIGFGHRRLSIMDVSSNGSQPMFSDDGNVVIILNGEVYNFKEIREDLVARGYSFHSDSDTEVVLKAYQEYGINSVQKFIGMFAYAIYDKPKQLLYLLRDRAGVKPLYYYHKNGNLLFASELKAIYAYPAFEKEISKQAVSLYFKYGYIRAPHTIFRNTYKLRPGHYLQVDLKSRQVKEVQYYNVLDFYNKPKLRIGEEEAAEEVEKLFTSAFQYRMVSDVPVGVFLSGGYDSGVVTAILQKNNTQKIKTFTIGFNEEKYNEAPHAKAMANYLGTDHHEHYCTTKEALDIFPTIPDIYDEPFGSSSAIPTTLVSQFARKHVTVSLSADGGDEIFAGYHRYQHLHKVNSALERSPQFLRKAGKALINASTAVLPPIKKVHKIGRMSEILNSYGNYGLADIYSQQYTIRELASLMPGSDVELGLYDDLGKINNENDFINTCLALDYNSYMIDDILVKVDRATMSVGLEGREPLIDHRIVEFVSQLPSNLKYNNGEKKYLLKKITHKYIPKEMMDRPKTGFGIPVSQWLRNELKHFLFELINEEQIAKHNLISAKEAIAVRDNFLAGNDRRETQVWLLLVFQMWWNRWME